MKKDIYDVILEGNVKYVKELQALAEISKDLAKTKQSLFIQLLDSVERSFKESMRISRGLLEYCTPVGPWLSFFKAMNANEEYFIKTLKELKSKLLEE